MANIPQNDTYGIPKTSLYPRITDTIGTSLLKQGVGLPGRGQLTPESLQQARKEQIVSDYFRNYNVGTQQQLYAPQGNNMPIPSDYSGFAQTGSVNNNGVNLSWVSPTENAVIRNLPSFFAGYLPQWLPGLIVSPQKW